MDDQKPPPRSPGDDKEGNDVMEKEDNDGASSVADDRKPAAHRREVRIGRDRVRQRRSGAPTRTNSTADDDAKAKAKAGAQRPAGLVSPSSVSSVSSGFFSPIGSEQRNTMQLRVSGSASVVPPPPLLRPGAVSVSGVDASMEDIEASNASNSSNAAYTISQKVGAIPTSLRTTEALIGTRTAGGTGIHERSKLGYPRGTRPSQRGSNPSRAAMPSRNSVETKEEEDDEELLQPTDDPPQTVPSQPGAVAIVDNLRPPTASTFSADPSHAPPVSEVHQTRPSDVSVFTTDHTENSDTNATLITAQLAPTEEDVADRVKERLEKEFAERMETQLQERMETKLQERMRMEKTRNGGSTVPSVAVVTAEAVEVTKDDENGNSGSQSRRRTCIGIIVALVLAGIGAGIGVALSGGNSSNADNRSLVTSAPTAAPIASPSPTFTPQTAEFDMLVDRLAQILEGEPANTGRNVLEDRSTTQYRALDWLANQDTAGINMMSAPLPELLERYALAVLYYTTGGEDKWGNKYNFLTKSSVCEWRDVSADTFGGIGSCDEAGRVTEAKFESNFMTGTIPKELFLLEQLTSLHINNNVISGTLPTEIGLLSNLMELAIAFLPMSGPMPTEIGRLVNLTEARFDTVGFTGTLPSEIGNLQLLQLLDISRNSLTGVFPTEVGKMQALTNLQIFQNGFNGTVPTEWGQLTNLRSLRVEDTGLQGNLNPIFCSGLHPNLIDFYSDCVATDDGGIPAETTCSCCSNCCDAMGNCCSTVTECRIVNAEKMNNILAILKPHLQGDPISTDPLVFNDIESPQYRALYWLADVDSFDLDLANTTDEVVVERYALAVFYYATTFFGRWDTTAPVLSPSSVCEWWNGEEEVGIQCDAEGCVASIMLSDSNVDAYQLPSEIALFENLTIFDCSDNYISGFLPTEIGKLAWLEELNLSSNEISGAIPTEYGDLSSLRLLDLSSNFIGEEIPSELGRLLVLEELYLDDNGLTGALPSEIGDLSQLGAVSVSGNSIIGEVPPQWGNLTKLYSLRLEGNSITGNLTEVFCDGSFQFSLFSSDCKEPGNGVLPPETECACCTRCCERNDVCVP